MAYYFGDLRLETHPLVYEPAEDSALLAKNLEVKKGDEVLDIGTGTGIQAIVAARKGGHVLAVDINTKALRLAENNASANGAGNIVFRKSDLFSNIGEKEKFDLIVFNPPYVPSKEGDMHARSWAGGKGGREVMVQFIRRAHAHLKEGGRIQLLVSSLNNLEKVKKIFSSKGFDVEVVAKEKLWFEELYVLTAKRRQSE